MPTALKSLRSQNVGTTAVQIGAYTAPSVATGVVIVGLSVANFTGASININAYLWDGTIAVYMIKNSIVLPGTTLSLADKGNRITMNAGDQVFVVSSVASSCDVLMSVAEIT